MKTIYVVVGSNSDYEGTFSWNVKAFTAKDKAEAFAELLNQELSRLLQVRQDAWKNLAAEQKSLGTPVRKKREHQRNWDKRVEEWLEKGTELEKKYRHRFDLRSEYEPNMDISKNTDYEVEELILEEL